MSTQTIMLIALAMAVALAAIQLYRKGAPADRQIDEVLPPPSDQAEPLADEALERCFALALPG